MSTSSNFISKITRHIRKNVHKPDYQISDLCGEVKLSRSQVYRKIKEISGRTFTDLLYQARMDKSLTLLQSNQHNISEIASKVGFRDTSYFIRSFRKKYGVTPGQFRERIAVA
ncbi:MAG: helix-turn-helix transcriptional regulator [Saprospiraceae bacterium]|nr:helix-turn-helix transcriptional regulator [Saprospiraceae bacterium]